MSLIHIVDDEPSIREILAKFLEHDGHHCRVFGDAAEALEALHCPPLPHVIISDIMMPGISGLDFHALVKGVDPELPVLMVTGQPSVESAASAVQNNAFDYLLKPIRRADICAAAARAIAFRDQVLESRRLAAENEEYRRNLEGLVRERTAALEATVHRLEREIEQRRQAEENLHFLAFHDAETRLPNRLLFKERLASAVRVLSQEPGGKLVVLAIELAGASVAARHHGDEVADELVDQFVERVQAILAPGDTLARLSNYEFGLLLDPLEPGPPVAELVTRLRQLTSAPFVLESGACDARLLIGVLEQSAGKASPEEFLQDAFIALREAKDAEGEATIYYSPMLRRDLESRLRNSEQFRDALFRAEIRPAFQPLVDIATGEPFGFETLARWVHPERGEVSPGEFIPIAEDTGAILQLGEFMLERACGQLAAWSSRTNRPLRMHVNVSARQLASPTFIGTVSRVIESTGIDPSCLVLELTESVFFNLGSKASLHDLKSLGVRLCLDDFGKGYSSLSYLHQLPIEVIKLDGSFVSGLPGNQRSAAIVRVVRALADSFGLDLIAEGVETEEQRQHLREAGYVLGQGYLFGRPVSGIETGERWFPGAENAAKA